MAVSIDLLAFYCALFERSCDAVNAIASALHTHYVYSARILHGKQQCKLIFKMVSCLIITQQEPVQEPFWRSLALAVQWYNVLQVQVERQVEASLQICWDCIKAFKDTQSAPLAPHISMSVATPARSFTPTTPSPSQSSSDQPFKCALVASTPCSILSSEMSLYRTDGFARMNYLDGTEHDDRTWWQLCNREQQLLAATPNTDASSISYHTPPVTVSSWKFCRKGRRCWKYELNILKGRCDWVCHDGRADDTGWLGNCNRDS